MKPFLQCVSGVATAFVPAQQSPCVKPSVVLGTDFPEVAAWSLLFIPKHQTAVLMLEPG